MAQINVIIPCYNQEKYIAEAMDGVLKQTINDFEIIIVNDGATDGSANIISKYASNNPDKIQSKKAKELLSKYGITINNQFEFVAETMFWARSCLFKPIQHKFSLSDFEFASKDGHTLAHIFERILATYHEYKTSDNMKLISRIKAKKKIKHIISRVCRFILQKKISYSNILTIKFLRIPVYRR